MEADGLETEVLFMKREIRLYNMMFPIWLLWMFPPAWLVILPGNLLFDGLVLFLSLTVLHRADRKSRMRSLLLPFWGCGFMADFAGVAWMEVGHLVSDLSGAWTIYNTSHPAALAWTLSAVAVSSVCIYAMDRAILKGELSPLPDRDQYRIALAMAVVTAPWTFFIPLV